MAFAVNQKMRFKSIPEHVFARGSREFPSPARHTSTVIGLLPSSRTGGGFLQVLVVPLTIAHVHSWICGHVNPIGTTKAAIRAEFDTSFQTFP